MSKLYRPHLGWILVTLVLAGCAATMEQRVTAMRQVESPDLPVQIDGQLLPQSQMALVEVVAPDFGAWIVAIDGTPIAGFNELSPDTVFLKPGPHEFQVMFMNLQVFGSSTKKMKSLQASVEAGHAYMPHNVGFDHGRMTLSNDMTFSLLDYGSNFPRDCLTGQITKRKNAQIATFEVRQKLYQECIAENGYQDTHTYVPPGLYQ